MENEGPLKGIRVLDLTTYLAAPSCARMLADLGAQVIKVESLKGDVWRFYGVTYNVPVSDEENPIFDIVNANKRGIALDLKTAEGKKIFHELLEKSDVFVTNTRAAALKRMELDYESLKEKYPKLIYAHLTGFGDTGPDVDQPGFDVVAFWARSGFLIDLVKPGEYPIYTPSGFGDISTGTTLFGGICAALYNREKTKKGERVTVSLYGTAVWFTGMLNASTQEGYGNVFPKERYAGNPLTMPYRCKDKQWLMLSILDFDKLFKPFLKALGLSHYIGDERFITRADMIKNNKELILILEKAFLKKDSLEWSRIFRKADIVHDKLRHFKDVSKDEQAIANNFIYEYEFSNGNKAMLPNPPIKFNSFEPLIAKRGPLLGENTIEVLSDLGYTQKQIEKLKNDKVIK